MHNQTPKAILFAARMPDENKTPILITYGLQGYDEIDETHPAYNVEDYNAARAITPAMSHAAIGGSMFGWHTPGAAPARLYAEIRLTANFSGELREDTAIAIHNAIIALPEDMQDSILDG